ncbi:MAG: hypothetical protein H6779_01240 [Candidatus Nomurabacteria bacterium]|nr:MAG: hypothetical protein H6779_01240 [Candidatus Nomurabacteria bacterium]
MATALFGPLFLLISKNIFGQYYGDYLSFALLSALLLTLCVFLGIYLYVLLPLAKKIMGYLDKLENRQCEKLKNELSEKLDTLYKVPENKTGLAKYQLYLFREKLSTLSASGSKFYLSDLKSLKYRVRDFIKKRGVTLELLKEKVISESGEILGAVTKANNEILRLSSEGCGETGVVLENMQTKADKLRNEIIIILTSVSTKEDTVAALATSRKIMRDTQELLSEARTVTEAKMIHAKYKT